MSIMEKTHENAKTRELIFDDPRLHMTIAGRLVVRVMSYLGYSTLVAATITFLLTDVEWLYWTGVLCLLFLVDRLIRRRDPDRFIFESAGRERVNVAPHLTPRAFGTLERAYERSALMGTDVALEILHHLTAYRETKECIERLDMRLEEFKQRVELLLTESKNKKSGVPDEECRATLAVIATRAFEDAEAHRHKRVDVDDLLATIPFLENEYVERLRDAFALRREDLSRAALVSRVRRETTPALFGFGRTHQVNHHFMNRAWTARPTPTLDRYSVDYTDLARAGYGSALIGHTAEYERLVQALSRPVNPRT